VSQKNIPDIFHSNLNKNYQILIIFGVNIFDTTCHQMTVQFSPHPMSASALPGESRQSKICVEKMGKKTSINSVSLDLCPQELVDYKI